MNFNQLSQKEDVLYQEVIKLTKQSIEDISKLFNRKDVLFHKQNLTSILAALESILDEFYCRLTDVQTIILFVKLYNLNYLLWISDELNDLELQLE